MTNPNDKIFSEQIRRRIALERLSDQQADDALKFLNEVRRDVVSKLAKAGEVSGYTQRQQRLLLDSIDRAHREIYSRLTKDLFDDQRLLAEEEAKAQASILRGATSATVRELSITQAYEVAKARPMQGRFLEDWLKGLEPSHRERLNAALRISFIEGETQSAAYRRISETLAISGNGLRALIRTSNSHISSAVTQASYEENPDLIKEYEWRSTLDSRTTPICQTRDGERYPVGKGPIPPAHVSCRSTTTPILDGFPPPKRITYNEWLANQPADVQDEALGGKKRGNAYRDGEGSKGFRPRPPVRPKPTPKPPPPPPPPKLPATPTHSFTREQHKEVLFSIRKEAQPFAKKVLDKLAVGPMDGPNVRPSDAYFSPFRNLVYMPKKYATGSQGRAVMMHEQGHAIDFAKTTQLGIPRSAAFVPEAGEDLAELSAQRRLSELNPDRPLKKLTAAQKQSAKDLTPTTDDHKDPFYTPERQAELTGKIEKALASGDPNDIVHAIVSIGRTEGYKTQKGYEWALFSDYLEAITKTRWGEGHGAAYYKQFPPLSGGYTTGNATEAFANAFALLGGPNGKAWRAIFAKISPRFSERVLKLLAEDIEE
jgi:SPP1 gp7 family putative phage head morphogenesis protein